MGKAVLSDEELRDRIFALLAKRDDKVLPIIEEHQERIRALFPSWTTIPKAVSNDRLARDTYANGLIMVAQIFEQSGDDSLIRRLTAPRGDNPMERLKKQFIEGQKAADDDRFKDAVRLLEPLVAELRTMSGSFVDEVLCRACGTTCEGESVMFTRFVVEHLQEAESLIGGRARSLSWLAADIVPAGHMQEGALRGIGVEAKRWLFVMLAGRVQDCKTAHRMMNGAFAAGVEVTALVGDKEENNVLRMTAAKSAAVPPRRIPANATLREHAGGLFRGSVWQHLA